MLDILRSLRALLKISRVHTDGNIFRLHYSLTVIILMAFCIVITTKQYVGDPIDCIKSDNIDKSIMNTFCWFETTYSIPKAFNKKVGVDVSIDGLYCTSSKPTLRLIDKTSCGHKNRFHIRASTTLTIPASFSITNITSGCVSYSLPKPPPFICRDIFGELFSLIWQQTL